MLPSFWVVDNNKPLSTKVYESLLKTLYEWHIRTDVAGVPQCPTDFISREPWASTEVVPLAGFGLPPASNGYMWGVIVLFSPNFLFTFLGLKACCWWTRTAWKQSLLFTVRATISMVTGEYEEYNRVPELICSNLRQLISGKLKKLTVSQRLGGKSNFCPHLNEKIYL